MQSSKEPAALKAAGFILLGDKASKYSKKTEKGGKTAENSSKIVKIKFFKKLLALTLDEC